MSVLLNDNQILIEAVFKAIKEIEKDILLEDLKETTSIGLFFDAITKSKVDILGNYKVVGSFSIYYKVDGKDTNSRLKANKKLTELGQKLEQVNCEIDNQKVNIEAISLPTLEVREDNKAYIYKIILNAKYKKKGIVI